MTNTKKVHSDDLKLSTSIGSSIVTINHLHKEYGKGNVALDDINLNLEPGKIYGLLGPNGAGKTTIIKILAGLIKNYKGEILIDGNKIGVETKKIVSYLPDVSFINPNWTVNYAIEFYRDFFADFDKKKALNLVGRLNVDLNKTFKSLSKGTKEKLQLILTLSRNAKLYIFDEPIAGVDPAARELIFNLITSNRYPNSTILFSTHLIADAEHILDDFIFIKRGNIVQTGNVKETQKKTEKTIDELFREEFKCLEDF